MEDKHPFDFQGGEVLLFDKPKTWTSFDLVKCIRKLIRFKKVGHAGTLDPLATGLLILCTGKKTKTIESIQNTEKEYEVIFKLGATTPSYDAEHPPENIMDASHIDIATVQKGMEYFSGEIEQMPPIFSAVKIEGKRAYKAARAGKDIQLRPRCVNVYEFTFLGLTSPDHVSARIRCSKGTYIRSLVHDLGQQLGVGAYIQELKRTRIGPYSLENAWEIDEFASQIRTMNSKIADSQP